MGYEYKVSDVYDFAAAHGYETRTKGDEIEFKRCPYCNGGSSGDKYTFSVNAISGAFKCLRASCGKPWNIKGNMPKVLHNGTDPKSRCCCFPVLR